MTNVTQTDLVATISTKTNHRQDTVKEVLYALLSEITACTAAGSRVQLKGFGTFETKHSAARLGRNPRTGEQLEIAASSRLAFKASKPRT